MFVDLVRYLLGYVNFRAYGGFADRFVNLCAKENIPLWNMKNVDGRIMGATTIKGYLSIRKPAKKSGMKVRATEKRGLYFFSKGTKSERGYWRAPLCPFLLFLR